MRSSYKVFDSSELYFVSSTIVDWIPVFNCRKYFDILLDTLRYNQLEKSLKIIAYVIMPEHFHLLVLDPNLSNTMKSIKSYSAKKIIEQLEKDNKTDLLEKFCFNKKIYKSQSNYQVWQESFHPEQILTDKMCQQKFDYIHFNPVRRGLVEKAEDWRYSSAAYYYLDKKVDLEIYLVPV